MKRIHPVTGELFVPHRFKDGNFRMADPTKGKVKHHAKHQIAVGTETELRSLARDGFHLRMRGVLSGTINLISPAQIVL